ncbi:hypothetical protein HPB49_019920 [Dermacentor silvarum]|uniref:Uncharacterized protein n=1 Tax=Dermacentor silvarum TaxID=543639 RepID=A0ACB8E2D7_DERSI|nr:hypothetical protein HPB49_019920 [Dermacentor silvarum]
MSSEDIGLEPRVPIFVNEHLCPATKRLFGAENSKRKECGWKYAWTKNGKIFVRKSEGTPVISIGHADDLEKIEQ